MHVREKWLIYGVHRWDHDAIRKIHKRLSKSMDSHEKEGGIAEDEVPRRRKLLNTTIKLVPISTKTACHISAYPSNATKRNKPLIDTNNGILFQEHAKFEEKFESHQRGHSIITRTPERAIPAPIKSPISGKYPSNCRAQAKAKTIKKPP